MAGRRHARLECSGRHTLRAVRGPERPSSSSARSPGLSCDGGRRVPVVAARSRRGRARAGNANAEVADALIAGVSEELVDALLDVDQGGEVGGAEVDGLPALELEAVVVGDREVLARRGRRAVRRRIRRRRRPISGARLVAVITVG